MKNPTYAKTIQGRRIIGGRIVPLIGGGGARVRIHIAGPYKRREYTADKGATWHHTTGAALQETRTSRRLDILGANE